MADPVDAQIAALRGQLGAATDAELAALLGVQRSAISQWRKRGRVPGKALLDAENVEKARAAVVSAEARVRSLPATEREFARALAIVFVARYTQGDPERLLRWSASFDEVVLAAVTLLRSRQSMHDRSLADCYRRMLINDRFLEQDLVEALLRPLPSLPQ